MTDRTAPPPMGGSEKWLYCNGRQFKKLMKAGLFWLDENHQHVNSLNVFPVPDGDTGTNMLLTMRSAYGRIEELETNHVGKMADTLARGALMGARGNSGVILSQILRGLARALRDQETFNAEELARAFQSASDTAYGGVMRPVEGTILTVIREGAAEAADAVAKSHDLRFLLERVLERCKQALERTPEQLPILQQAGVVDSGGQGLVYIFEGMLRYVHGKMDNLDEILRDTALAQAVNGLTAQELAMPENGILENPYDVQFILMGENLNVAEVRRRIDAMGDSTVVVGDETTIKVHIHVENPGEPLAYGASLGQITDVVVENMQLQMEEIVHAGHPRPAEPKTPVVTVEPGQIGVVAIASGDGLINIFRSLGAAHVINGGQTNNPSTEEIFQAIQDVPTDKIIILPNNRNILLAASAASELSAKNVRIVPTVTIPQGLAAMLCLEPDADLELVVEEMQLAAEDVLTGQITRATRSVTLEGVEVNEGEYIGLVDGRLCASGAEVTAVLEEVLRNLELADREIVTLYYGQDVTRPEAETTAGRIGRLYPGLEVEVVPGGQAHYFYILGAE